LMSFWHPLLPPKTKKFTIFFSVAQHSSWHAFYWPLMPFMVWKYIKIILTIMFPMSSTYFLAHMMSSNIIFGAFNVPWCPILPKKKIFLFKWCPSWYFECVF
jgi:hypothetical protein